MRRTARTVSMIAGATSLVFTLAGFRYSGFGDSASKATAASATSWLSSQQLPDGSFEVAGFPGFETPDAIAAIAENAQLQKGWRTSQARAAVLATTNGGYSPLHAVDDLADAGLNAGQAAKIVVLVARPLGLSVTKFDPDNDGAVNLKSIVNAGKLVDGSYGTFNATLYSAIAVRKLGGTVAADTLAYIRAAQQPSGGWDYYASPSANDADVDTTSLAVEALAAAKVSLADTDLREALAFLANAQQASGAWQSFGSDDPNSTSVAILAITAAGYDVSTSCWRDAAVPALTGSPYASPIPWLRAQQAGDGHITSPNDPYGVNTFATSQTVQALRRGWLPITPLAKQHCP